MKWTSFSIFVQPNGTKKATESGGLFDSFYRLTEQYRHVAHKANLPGLILKEQLYKDLGGATLNCKSSSQLLFSWIGLFIILSYSKCFLRESRKLQTGILGRSSFVFFIFPKSFTDFSLSFL
ncbi:MAG: hypothetical protein IKA76_04270 [Clostridia bacterium]|nr:hypothetical protein [Clostridia bacterium]